MSKRERIIASLPPESEYEGEALIVRRMYVAGYTLAAIAAERGYSPTKVRDLLDPRFKDRRREASRLYKQNNIEEVRRKNREYNDANRATCIECGGSMGSGSGHRQNRGAIGVCRPCRTAAKEKRWRVIEGLWAEGKTFGQIAAEIGIKGGHLGVELDRMRKAGWNVPYRRTEQQRRNLIAGQKRARA